MFSLHANSSTRQQHEDQRHALAKLTLFPDALSQQDLLSCAVDKVRREAPPWLASDRGNSAETMTGDCDDSR